METNEEMTQGNENNTDTPDLGGECCSASSGSWKSLKTVLFVLVIVAACAVAAHSVLSNGTSSPCGGAATGLCPFNKPCGNSGICCLKTTDAENANCIIKEKANTTSQCCPGIETPACCPNAGTPDCCANTETPSGCPTTAAPGCCPSVVHE
jgi:hypothetical protein